MANAISTHDLALRISGAAYCFNLDPFVLASLIQKESLYSQDFTSPTGATGLTQLTSISIKMASYALGIKPAVLTSSAKQNAASLNAIIAGDCLSTSGEFKMMGNHYKPLWELAGAKAFPLTSKEQFKAMKESMIQYPEYAIVYAALLLKESITQVQHDHLSGCISYKSESPLSSKDQLRETLMRYYGDECSRSSKYANTILDQIYPKIVGAPAL